MSTTLAERVDDFLSQKRIAVAGVSRKENGTAGNAIYKRLRDVGYQVYAVNPNADRVEGDVCYPNLQAIPEKVDGVVIATRAEATEQVVRDCVEAGVSRVWMHDGIHSLGSSVSDKAVEFCKQHNISVIAGACPLMFGKPSDGGHRLIRQWFQLIRRLPA